MQLFWETMLTNRILKEVLHGYTLRTITCNTYISAIQRHEHVNCCKTKTRRFFSWCRHEDHLLQISSKAITCEKRLFSASTNNNDLGKLLYIGREKKRLKSKCLRKKVIFDWVMCCEQLKSNVLPGGQS